MNQRQSGRTMKLGKYAVTIFLSAMLIFSLPSTMHAVGKGAKGPDVYVIQGMLKSLGSYSGPIDGKYYVLSEGGQQKQESGDSY
ncbi:hypothetical protein H8B09_28145 [Paenibacillus sp. PR3]|uniref:Uncharacterized protein n=1 Tax=Paenibacillus terricola TaxID=2763503 RepID=A0ABR8N380_9BACL|nr:hypothetical protein [Paenibacillus terricola]MBD3922631.1 hypothetical protein [Paenibacillus terricola]